VSRATWSRVVATWFGVGRAPIAPGTAGTLAAVPLYLLAWWSGRPAVLLVLTVAVACVGLLAGGAVARARNVADPPEVVIDEVAGYLLTCWFGPFGWRTAAVAFVLFRVFDVTKPWPICNLESLREGWGVMADDLGAGLAAGAVVWLGWGLLAGHWTGVIGP
jgi:phosphatidylglycerophosphatase A